MDSNQTKPSNIPAIEKATTQSWSEWVKELDESGARNLTHAELAAILRSKLEGKAASYEWWAQAVAVAYEQHIGRRVPGQLANGLFEIAISKTTAKSRSSLFPQVVTWFESQAQLNGYECLRPRSSETPRRSTWRCDFADGSKFAATVEENGKKSKLVLSHTALPTKREADDWKDFWRSMAERLTKSQ